MDEMKRLEGLEAEATEELKRREFNRNGPCAEFPGYWVVECGGSRTDVCDPVGPQGLEKAMEHARERSKGRNAYAYVTWRAHSFDARWDAIPPIPGFGTAIECVVLPDGTVRR